MPATIITLTDALQRASQPRPGVPADQTEYPVVLPPRGPLRDIDCGVHEIADVLAANPCGVRLIVTPDSVVAGPCIIRGVKDVLIRGGGSSLVCGDTLPAMRLENCQRVTIRDMGLRGGRTPWSVVHVRGGGVQRAQFDGDIGAIFEYDTLKQRLGHRILFEEAKQPEIKDGYYQSQRLHSGDWTAAAIFKSRTGCASALEVRDCEDITISGVSVTDWHQMGISVRNTVGVRIEHCTALPELGASLSGRADGIHLNSCSDCWVSYNDIGHNGDDGIAIHSLLHDEPGDSGTWCQDLRGKWLNADRLGQRSMIARNRLIGCGARGIHVVSPFVEVVGNYVRDCVRGSIVCGTDRVSGPGPWGIQLWHNDTDTPPEVRGVE